MMKLDDIIIPMAFFVCGIVAFFFVLDITLGEKGKSTELIYHKEIKPAYVTYEKTSKGYTTIRHPEEYILYLRDYDSRHKITVRSITFHAVQDNQEVNTVFLVGKWTKIKYFQRVII